ncbi:MAG: hypothetical protein MUC58_10605 [Rhizobiaceae bacterium]|nr:hypothetical protein [Rhizobiaceae bacterium]
MAAAADAEAQKAAAAALDAHARTIANWWGISNLSSGIFGLIVSFAATIIVSLLTAAPSKAVSDMIDSIRKPGGAILFEEK